MARMWTCGFELQSVTALVETQDVNTVGGSPSISTSIHRGGAASLRVTPTAGTSYVEHQLTSGVVMRTMHRFYLYISALPAADCNVYGIGQSGYFPGMIRLRTDGSLILRDDQTGLDLGSATSPLSLGQWYRIEADFNDVAGTITAGTSAFKLYVDGTLASDQLCSNINGFSRVRAGALQSANSLDIYIDDIAVNDTTGTAQNGLPGPGTVVHLRPAGAGDSNGFATVVGGTAGAANNYTRASEITPDDATSYNATVATGTTTIDDFAVSSPTTAGIGASDAITLVSVGARIGSNATTTASIVTRIKGQASGTVSESASTSVAVNGWSTHKAAVPRLYQLTTYANPQTSTAWTRATLATAQIGYRSNVSQTTARRISTLWALVEYVPAGTTAALTLGSEIDTGQPLARKKTRAPGVASETGAAQALGRHKTKALGTALETSSSQALTGRKTKAAGVAAETDAAQALTWKRARQLGIASETEAAQTLTGRRIKSLTSAAETDAAQPVTWKRARQLGTAAETDSAQALGRRKTRALVLAAQVETAQALTWVKRRTLATAGATEAAQALARRKRATLPSAAETDAALAISGVQATALVPASESSAAQAVGRRKVKALSLAAETETAQPLVGRRHQALGVAIETTTAQAVGKAKRAALPRAEETATAVPLAPASGLVAAEETDVARPLGRAKTTVLGTAGEVGEARPLGRARARGLTGAVETTTARPLTGVRSRALVPAEETWTARLLGQAKARQLPTTDEVTEALPLSGGALTALDRAVETDAARPVTGRKTRALASSSVVESAQPVAGRKTRALGTAVESDTARTLGAAKRMPLPAAAETDTAQRLLIPGTAAPALETDTARPLTGSKRQALTPAVETVEAQQLGTQAQLALPRAVEIGGAQTVGHRKVRGLLLASGLDTARPLARAKRYQLGTAAEVSRALIGPKVRLTQAIDRTEALALTGHRQRPADHLDATTSGPVLATSATGPGLTVSSSGPRLTATTTTGG